MFLKTFQNTEFVFFITVFQTAGGRLIERGRKYFCSRIPGGVAPLHPPVKAFRRVVLALIDRKCKS